MPLAKSTRRRLHGTMWNSWIVFQAVLSSPLVKHSVSGEVRLGFGATDMTKEELKKLIDSVWVRARER